MAELRELSYAECRALLVRQETGRVAVATPDGPHIVPLNYSVVDESIVFRTTPFSILATYGRNAKLAFEVDHFRDQQQFGWSVIVRGRADVVTDPAELAHIRQIWPPYPWADDTLRRMSSSGVSGCWRNFRYRNPMPTSAPRR